MMRQIIRIDREKCDGCGLCADACHEGAIAMVNGKAKLVREDHCDGLGDCLPSCPSGAISFVTKDTLPFTIEDDPIQIMKKPTTHECECISKVKSGPEGEMTRWPIQLKLVPLDSRFLKDADILIASDCTAFVAADFQKKYKKDRVLLIGCPKLDKEDYGQRIAEIVSKNNIRSVSLVRIDIPCCSAMGRMVREGIMLSGKDVPLEVTVLTTDGTEVKQ